MAVTVYMGRDAAIGIGEESTYGTAVARTVWARLISASLGRKIEKVPRPHLVGSSASAARRAHYTSADNVEGDVEFEMAYEGMGMWIKHILGGTPSTSGTNPYTHTYKLAAALPTGLTGELIYGRADDGTQRSEIFEGLKVASARARIAVNEVARMSVSFIGETSQARAAAGTATFSTNDFPMLHSQAGTLSFNSVNYTCVSVEIVIDNSLTRRQLLGSNLTKAPMRSDFIKVELRATIELSDDNLITAFTADTQGDVAITFTGTSPSASTWTLHNGFITDYSDAPNSAGILMRTITWTGESDGTDEGLQFAITNSQASATAA